MLGIGIFVNSVDSIIPALSNSPPFQICLVLFRFVCVCIWIVTPFVSFAAWPSLLSPAVELGLLINNIPEAISGVTIGKLFLINKMINSPLQQCCSEVHLCHSKSVILKHPPTFVWGCWALKFWILYQRFHRKPKKEKWRVKRSKNWTKLKCYSVIIIVHMGTVRRAF